MSSITTYCRLTSDTCTVNGSVVARLDPHSEDSWFKQIYRSQELAYPKFHKMDALSQAGYLASELMKKSVGGKLPEYADNEVGMVFANRSSSADTDLKFLASYQDGGSPSPSLFVYTLPNIVLGELAILNKWYGEHMFAVLPNFEPDFFLTHVPILQAAGSRAVICGWLEVLEGNIDVLLFWVEDSNEEKPEFTREALNALFES